MDQINQIRGHTQVKDKSITEKQISDDAGIRYGQLSSALQELINNISEDDILEFDTFIDFPETGVVGKIYVDVSTNLFYRWSSSAWVDITGSSRSSYIQKSITFSGTLSAEIVSADIIEVGGNRIHLSQGQLYISNDLGAGNDTNISCRLSFYSKDTKTLDTLLKEFFFNLTYSELSEEWALAGTGGTCDNSSGLVARDKLRLIGGTAETVAVVEVIDSTTLEVTVLVNTHAIDEGMVKIAELPDFDLEDLDEDSEIHIEFECYDAPAASMNVYFVVDVVVLG